MSQNLIFRILTGIVFVTFILGGILINEYSFFVAICVVEVLALLEFYQLIEVSKQTALSRLLSIFGGFLLFVGSFVYCSGILSSFIVFTPYILYFLTLLISELYLKRHDPIKSLAYATLGQLYLAVPISLMNYIAFNYEDGVYSFVYLLALFLFLWVNDSFAYIFGVSFGKHKMFERVSPKKSWEGFAGGAVSTVVASTVFAHYFTGISIWGWIGFALVVISFGTLGDLIESLIKRTLKVKDSGTMLPGHGGVLDRFDSMILAVPALVVYIEILNFTSKI